MTVVFIFPDGSRQILRPLKLESTAHLDGLANDLGAVKYYVKT
jgi:hypothetical protein